MFSHTANAVQSYCKASAICRGVIACLIEFAELTRLNTTPATWKFSFHLAFKSTAIRARSRTLLDSSLRFLQRQGIHCQQRSITKIAHLRLVREYYRNVFTAHNTLLRYLRSSLCLLSIMVYSMGRRMDRHSGDFDLNIWLGDQATCVLLRKDL